MLGFKRFGNAAVTISGIELAHKVRKGQFDTPELSLDRAQAQELWQTVWQRNISDNKATPTSLTRFAPQP
jgi:hypothetical protein